MTAAERPAAVALLEEASAVLLSAAPSDMTRLARALTLVEQAAERARSEGAGADAIDALARIRETVERIIFDEAGPFDRAVDLSCRAVEAIVRHLRDGEPAAAASSALAPLLPGAGGSGEPGPAGGGAAFDVSDLIGEFVSTKLHALEEFEAAALSLERAWSEERRKEMMRIVHTMKGEAAVLGLPDLEHYCHEFEDYLERHGRSVSFEYILRARDFLKGWIEALGTGSPAESPSERLLPELMLLKRGASPAAASAAAPAEPAEEHDTPPVFRKKVGLTAKLKADEFMVREFGSSSFEHLEQCDAMLMRLERDPADRAALDAVFRAFHTVKGMSSFIELDDLTALAHEAENLFQKARDGEFKLSGYAIDLVFLTVDTLRSMVQTFLQAFDEGRDPDICEKACGLILSLRKAGMKRREHPSPDAARERAGGAPEEEPFFPAAAAEAASPGAGGAEPAAAGGAPGAGKPDEARAQFDSVKVDAKKLDHLADLIGELVIVESMVVGDQDMLALHSQRLMKNLSHLGKICRELQEMAMSLRMMPLKSVFQKMARVARDIAKKLGKRIDLAISGEETEIDRMLVERIHDPLIHMIRNAVDHGIEKSVEERIARGKSPEGRVRLSARHEGGKIVIEVGDDGGGLDRDRILAKARNLGLVGPDASSLTDAEVHAFVFAPGFSTAEKVSDVSGRGVGMDVVRKNIEELRGRVEIRSAPNEGTSFKIMLPLTLAIIDGMIVRSGERRFILPTLSIVESLRMSEVAVTGVVGGAGRMFELRGSLLPLFDFGDYFSAPSDALFEEERVVVVLQDFGNRAGILVDELIGQQQIVIKSIHGLPGDASGVSGGAILADGSVGLIVDPAAVLRDLIGERAESAAGEPG